MATNETGHEDRKQKSKDPRGPHPIRALTVADLPVETIEALRSADVSHLPSD